MYSVQTKTCTKCSIVKQWEAFSKQGNGKHGLRSHCKACCSAAGKQRYLEFRDSYKIKGRANHLQKTFGLTLTDFTSLLTKQKGTCAICNSNTPGGRGTWHVDHCHESGTIRGLLCMNCNQGLGRFHDNTTFLQNAINYLQLNQ